MMEDKGLHLIDKYNINVFLNNLTQDSTQVTQSLIGYRQDLVGLILIIFLIKLKKKNIENFYSVFFIP